MLTGAKSCKLVNEPQEPETLSLLKLSNAVWVCQSPSQLFLWSSAFAYMVRFFSYFAFKDHVKEPKWFLLLQKLLVKLSC